MNVLSLRPACPSVRRCSRRSRRDRAPPESAQTQVERGEYLARAGDCISCHTAQGGAPFAGGLRLDTPFGYMLSPNITPDPETGIGRWSGDDFYRALHHGVNKRGQDMYPTMPYDFYTRVTRADVDAIYAYLRTVKPVRNVGRRQPSRLPVQPALGHGRVARAVLQRRHVPARRAKSASWNRGAYLVEGLGHCSDCHSPRNLMGGIEKSKDFTGAVIDGWFALDLTSDIATGLGSWTAQEHRDLSQDRRGQGQDDHARADGRGHPQQPELPDRRRPPRDGRVPEVAAAGLDACAPDAPRRTRRRRAARSSTPTTAAAATRRWGAGSRACSRRSRATRVVLAPIRTTSSRSWTAASARATASSRCPRSTRSSPTSRSPRSRTCLHPALIPRASESADRRLARCGVR